MKIVLPTNTNLTRFMNVKGHIFGVTKLDSKQYMLKIVHTWGDGEIMNFGYSESNGTTIFPTEQSPNPRHIVKVFNFNPSMASIYKAVNEFLPKYYPNESCCNEASKCIN